MIVIMMALTVKDIQIPPCSVPWRAPVKSPLSQFIDRHPLPILYTLYSVCIPYIVYTLCTLYSSTGILRRMLCLCICVPIFCLLTMFRNYENVSKEGLCIFEQRLNLENMTWTSSKKESALLNGKKIMF